MAGDDAWGTSPRTVPAPAAVAVYVAIVPEDEAALGGTSDEVHDDQTLASAAVDCAETVTVKKGRPDLEPTSGWAAICMPVALGTCVVVATVPSAIVATSVALTRCSARRRRGTCAVT